MRQTYTVDNLVYEFQISATNEVTPAITGGASPTFQPEPDPFDWGHVPAVTADIGGSRFPVTVLRQPWRYLLKWIGNERPPYFTIAALADRRRKLYCRVARRLTARFPYQLTSWTAPLISRGLTEGECHEKTEWLEGLFPSAL
ncbi:MULTISPECIES: hypothetical protein [unclassified Alcanivorax]|jgi:hypothetical protein|uniref:hypothetical protein n=1 Tax=unclassified Alcanivorax TaxID=2638842 RepID=UPI0012DC4CDB|nr:MULTISPECIES: hypothetical protein [unclassified Alcanivorax]